MSRSRRSRPACGIAASVALGLALLVTSAGAQDAKPTPCTTPAPVNDPAGDQTAPPAFAPNDSTDVLTLFARHDAAKGPEASTMNFHVKNLALEVPNGFTSLTWQAIYRMPDDTQMFVRAVLDFSGDVSFEYGDFVDLQETSSSVYRGETTGKVFEGADGVVQVVIPADRGGAAGSTINEVYAETRVGRTLPNAITTPTRGLANAVDTVPDDGATAAPAMTLAPCDPAAPPPAGSTPPPAGSTPPGSAPAPERALPVTLLTKSVRTAKVKRKLALRLRSSERVTDLAAQLRKGRKVISRGKLATLDGAGTLALKVKRFKRGAYVLDLVGNDAQGARRFASYRIRAR